MYKKDIMEGNHETLLPPSYSEAVAQGEAARGTLDVCCFVLGKPNRLRVVGATPEVTAAVDAILAGLAQKKDDGGSVVKYVLVGEPFKAMSGRENAAWGKVS